jgi:hypothetical protein
VAVRQDERTALALAALAEITDPADVGELLAVEQPEPGVVDLRFACALSAYAGWSWTVSTADVLGQEPTVLEVELLPGEGALLAPPWVPWAERLAEWRRQHPDEQHPGEGDSEDEAELDDEAEHDDEDGDLDEDDLAVDEDDLAVDDELDELDEADLEIDGSSEGADHSDHVAADDEDDDVAVAVAVADVEDEDDDDDDEDEDDDDDDEDDDLTDADDDLTEDENDDLEADVRGPRPAEIDRTP